MAFLQPNMSEPPSLTQAPSAPTTSEPQSAFFSQRARRQLTLFAVGAGFVGLSVAVTRRSIIRRNKIAIPKFYQPSNHPSHDINGAMEAFEALNLATLNVFSVGMMAAGGALWAFDVSSLEDMRKMVRTNMGMDEVPRDQESEEEIEEWVASILSRKEFKALRGDKGVSDEILEEKIKRARERLERETKKEEMEQRRKEVEAASKP